MLSSGKHIIILNDVSWPLRRGQVLGRHDKTWAPRGFYTARIDFTDVHQLKDWVFYLAIEVHFSGSGLQVCLSPWTCLLAALLFGQVSAWAPWKWYFMHGVILPRYFL